MLPQERDIALPRFYTRSIPHEEDGKNTFKDVEYVEIVLPGSRDIWDGPVEQRHRERFKPYYEAWKEGLEPPEEGIPLKEWTVIPPSMADELIHRKCKTVEQLASLPDAAVPQGFQKFKQKANVYLENIEDNAKFNKLFSKCEDLTSKVKSLQEKVGALETENQMLRAEKPKRGKPKK
ncbi:MAG: hypothetical protein MJA83_15845 [Gammaproteobacteria bacterium]|nr:hypothetical protein [Gammaproteobacteria bacterium]